jgi:hypothetical protein
MGVGATSPPCEVRPSNHPHKSKMQFEKTKPNLTLRAAAAALVHLSTDLKQLGVIIQPSGSHCTNSHLVLSLNVNFFCCAEEFKGNKINRVLRENQPTTYRI